MGSLKTFIKSVRSAKTLKDERDVIQKESAKIRSAFRQSTGASSRSRRENVAKLLYLFTLGERTHFGQVECLKLLASPKFTDKRLGYLGTMLLLDEDQEVLMLVTNSIDNDLNHPNMYVVSLALTTLANIAGASMARDLFQRVEKLMSASNPYIKKKAALCALRVLRRVPEYDDIFVEHAKALLTEDNHGVLLCGCSLVTDMIDNNPDLVPQFAPVLPRVLQKLKQLSSNGFAPEFDVGGVPDPFLQCKMLRLLRAMGQDNAELSEQMSDLLAAIATNTDNSKNVGNAVLYETVLTIFGIDTGEPQSDSGLRVLGINILAKFLTTKNINTRYAALNTLLRVVQLEPAAVQRHRQTILDCINDPDVSIRRRALDLSYVLINAQNVRLMVKELLSVLQRCDAEFKPQLVFQIALNAERFAPTVRWHIDTLLKMFMHAGNQTRENVMSAFILLVINAPELQLYATQQAFAALTKDLSQQGLTIVTLWLLGEYGDVLLKQGSFALENESEMQEVTPKTVVSLVHDALHSPFENEIVQAYGINALIKLSTRIKDARELEKIRQTIDNMEVSVAGEIQQRAVEYTALLGENSGLRRGILARMPAPEFGDDLEAQHAKAMSKALIRRRRRPPTVAAQPKPSAAEEVSNLLDLGDAGSAPSTNVAAAADLLTDIFSSNEQPSQVARGNQDILSLFGTSSTQSSVAPSSSVAREAFSVKPASAKTSSQASALNDLSASLAVPNQPSVPAEALLAWENEDLSLSFMAGNESPGQAQLTAYFMSKSPVSDINLQVALPKTQQLALQGISQASLDAGVVATQKMRVSGNPGAAIKLRMRLSYTRNEQPVLHQFDFGKLPRNLL